MLARRKPMGWRADFLQPREKLAKVRKARKPVKRRRSTPRRRPPEFIDEAYLEHLRHQPCRVTWWHEHARTIDPHHARHDEHGASVGAGMKDDRRACSLCRICHGCIDELSGPFKGMTGDQVRAWVDEQILQQRAAFLTWKAKNPPEKSSVETTLETRAIETEGGHHAPGQIMLTEETRRKQQSDTTTQTKPTVALPAALQRWAP